MFAFNASAVGFGGVITAPKRKVLSSVASSVLSPTGGEGTAVETNYCQDGVAFDRAVTSVWGFSPDGESYTTRTHVEINGLRMFDRLEIDSLSATLTSNRMAGQNESNFSFVAEVGGVRVDSLSIETTTDCSFFEDKTTYADFMRYVGIENQDLLDQRFAWGGLRPVPNAELVRCTLLRPAHPSLCGQITPTIFRDAHTIQVADFGDVHLGEVLIKPGLRRVNLVRLELRRGAIQPLAFAANRDGFAIAADGDESGSFTSGSGEANGTQVFP